MLEGLDHGDKSFVTLTYAPEKMPDNGSVSPVEFRNWLKRLRKRVAPRRIRFYGVGEYGDTTDRPHYHCALYGWPSCLAGETKGGVCQCVACSVVRETWGFGHIHSGQLTRESAQYLAGYVTKKMTRFDDPRLNGRHPEFARMSLRPGIGATAMWDVASVMMQWNLEKKDQDVPKALNHSGRNYPLGRYLTGKLREMVGKDGKSPEGTLQELADKVSLVRRFAFDNSRSTQSVFEEINAPYANKLVGRDKLKGRVL